MNAIAAIIFDLDGVLVNSEPLHVQAEHAICRQYGIDAPWSEWQRFKGQTDQAMFAYLVQHFTDGAIAVAELIQAKQAMFAQLLAEELQPIPGALEFIRWAKTRYGKLALTTSSEPQNQQQIFARYGLQPYFDVVITSADIQRGKPHPEPYLKTLAALRLPGERCVVIEDSLAGVQSAKAAGCRVVGLTTSFAREQLWEAGADVVVDHFGALFEQMDDASMIAVREPSR